MRREELRAGHEYESVDGNLTGRSRPTQFEPTQRYLAVPPSQRVSLPFERAVPSGSPFQGTKGTGK